MGSAGRPPRYDWDDKKDICYQLYVEQKKSPPEIVRYFANHFGVPESEIPSARLFRRQFLEKWNFPRRIKRLTPDEEALVVERIKQLWEQNLRVREIKETLEDEGWGLRPLEFRRLRLQNDFKRREGNQGAKRGTSEDESGSSNKRRRGESQQQMPPNNVYGMDPAMGATNGFDAGANALMALHSRQDYGWTAQNQTQYIQHVAQPQGDYDQAPAKRNSKKKTRGRAQLPADIPSAESRFNSETTLTECKDCLRLDNDMYMAIRSDFEQICVEHDVERKKAALDSGLWQQVKDQLVRENMHLSALMHPLQPDLEKKAVALDNICCDVTKRMRVMNKGKLRLAEANNLLGLNPRISKQVRGLFQDILARGNYTNRQECGEEHWTEMRNEWHAMSPILTQAVADSLVNPRKMKAIDLLGREAVKRYTDDKTKAELQLQNGHAPGKPPKPKGPPRAVPPKRVPPPKEPKPRGRPRKDNVDPQLDPALAALDDPIPVDFRLGPDSHIVGYHPRIWHGELKQRSVQALHQAARSRAGAANVTSVQGILKNGEGMEVVHTVVENEDLDGYLNAAGDVPTFVVVLEGGYA
ncbi:Clr5 domain [Teratosphaeria destructans]|uniref:Clr5 domain n=1 Tax=Teratosphaeria destructans TaxID=418781 RepID=A0A9W7SK68_9PEZI|nr:Clr5 domain [Teratosphaeria destructans]